MTVGAAEDRAGVGTRDDENEREKVRQRWKLKCKNGKLYVGDFVQRAFEESILFRTMFFSSGLNCARQWVSIDWKLSAKWIDNAPDPARPWLIEFEELGRDEG